MKPEDNIVIYETKDGQAKIDVQLKDDTVWLSNQQMAELFARERSVITKHTNNVFKEGELDEKSNVQILHISGSDRPVKFYNLDVIISVGYRIKSPRGTQFRIWSTKILREYLVKGYVANEKRLSELQKVILLQDKVISNYQLEDNQAEGLIKVIANYAQALDMLDDYDHQRLTLPISSTKEVFKIGYNEAKKAIETLAEQTNFQGLFGKEKDDSFKGSLENIYQTFDGHDLYPNVEEKAAHLLYFVTKNHSFTDGNKRIAAFLFVWFLGRNMMLLREDGQKRLPDNTLVALTLLIAESNPDDKDMMIKLTVNLLTEKP